VEERQLIGVLDVPLALQARIERYADSGAT
jgi:hypothetical protein